MGQSGISSRRRSLRAGTTRSGSAGFANWVRPSHALLEHRLLMRHHVGAFDNKQDLSAFQTAASFFPSVLGTAAAVPGTDGAALTLAANPKLGLAPLSMEMGFSSLT